MMAKLTGYEKATSGYYRQQQGTTGEGGGEGEGEGEGEQGQRQDMNQSSPRPHASDSADRTPASGAINTPALEDGKSTVTFPVNVGVNGAQPLLTAAATDNSAPKHATVCGTHWPWCAASVRVLVKPSLLPAFMQRQSIAAEASLRRR
jgi:hypothetical protein